AGREYDSGDGAFAREDLRCRRAGADFRAGFARGGGHGGGERAHATPRDGGRAGRMRIGGGPVQEGGGGACGPGSGGGAEDGAGGGGGAHEFGLKDLCHEIGNGHGRPAEELEHFLAAEFAEAAAGVEKFPEIGQVVGECVNGRRGEREQGRGDGGGAFQRAAETRVAFGVRGREAAEGFHGTLRVRVEREGAAVGMHGGQADAGLHHFQAVARELHVRGDV